MNLQAANTNILVRNTAFGCGNAISHTPSNSIFFEIPLTKQLKEAVIMVDQGQLHMINRNLNMRS
jgi:hypothetical protein